MIELSNLYHLANTALSGQGASPTKHARMVWASKEFGKLHPEISSTRAYKEISREIQY